VSALPPTAAPARVGAVALAASDEALDAAALRQRACTELLRQAAIAAGLLDATDSPPVRGATSEEAESAIERLLERELAPAAPDEASCRRLYDAQPSRWAVGEQARLRHVLFAVVDGVDIAALRTRAEACLLELRARAADDPDRFPDVAQRLSNCPSGAQGGALGWLAAADCVPEFAREVYGRPEVGVLPRLVATRFGLHVVEVLERRPGRLPPYDEVRAAIAATLARQAYASALRGLLQRLAARTAVEGVELGFESARAEEAFAADSPPVR
jgi:peptidyl-prolyl cis-trans isomerase C